MAPVPIIHFFRLLLNDFSKSSGAFATAKNAVGSAGNKGFAAVLTYIQ